MTDVAQVRNRSTGETRSLSPIAYARFFENRDPRDWEVLYEAQPMTPTGCTAMDNGHTPAEWSMK